MRKEEEGDLKTPEGPLDTLQSQVEALRALRSLDRTGQHASALRTMTSVADPELVAKPKGTPIKHLKAKLAPLGPSL